MRILALIFLLSILGYAHAKVLGVDNRVPMPSGWPYDAVGIVTTDQGGVCSGVLVAASTVLTARHCVRGQGGVQFTLANGEVAFMTSSQMGAGPQRTGDFAFLRINREFNFWVQVGTPTAGSQAFVAGTDTNLGLSLWASGASCVWREIEGLVRHGCSTGPGTSGAPVFMKDAGGSWVVGALNVAEANAHVVCAAVNLFGECFNAAVPSHVFSSVLSEFLTR